MSMRVPTIFAIAVGPEEETVIGIFLEVSHDIDGSMMFLLDLESGHYLADKLLMKENAVHEQMEVFKQLPDLPITDGHVQQVINSHEKGWAMIVPCKITYELAKEVQANRARSKEE